MTTEAPVNMAPVVVGPTWRRNAGGAFVLPRRTLGYQVLAWTHQWLLQPDGPDSGQPWEFTQEQARFVLWWYAVDRADRFAYRNGVFRRMKGHGKDPLGAVLCAIEMVGPSRFGWWDSAGRPVAIPNPAAWVQTAATSHEQTKNTMTLFPGLFSPSAIGEYGIDLGKERIYARGGTVRIEAVTSSPATLEGARSTFVLMNETHHWNGSNEGHEMASVIQRNLAKSRDGAARALAITNAHQPGEDSVAERDWEAWLKIDSKRSRATGFLYDSLEAPAETVLADREMLHAALTIARGDSTWLDVERLIEEIYDPRTPPSTSRRFYLNQVVAAEDAWCTPQEWDANADESRQLEAGDQIALFFDGSKSDDTTGLLACRIGDGAVFRIGEWAKPEPAQPGWTVPREQVDGVVDHVFATYDVVAFFADPGTGEDESGARYWDALLDRWANEYGERLCAWAVQSGSNRHAVLWDMRDTAHQKDFTAAVERALADIQAKDFPHNGDTRLKLHVSHARRWPNRYGITIGKESRTSARKIDLAVCAIGARMVRRIYLALPDEKKRQLPSAGPMFFGRRALLEGKED